MFRRVLILAALILGCGVSVSAQGFRIGDAQPVSSSLTSTSPITPLQATVAVCVNPANAVPCTNKASTFTSVTLVTGCSAATQVVLTGTTTCVTQTDARGNWGAWVAAGNYDVTFTLSTGQSFGPYTISVGIPPGTNISPGNLTVTGTGTFRNINNCIIVDGSTTYPLTDIGINAAITAAKAVGGSNCVQLGMNTSGGQAYVIGATVTIAAGLLNNPGNSSFTFYPNNAIFQCEFSGTCMRIGESTVEHSHVQIIGNFWIERTSSGVYSHDFSAGSTGLEILNVNGGTFGPSLNISGFRNGLYLRASNNHSSYYNHIFPQYFTDNMIDYLERADSSGASVNDNYIIGGEAQKATGSYDFSAATNGGFGGFCIVIDSTGNAGSFSAQANYHQTSCENAVGVGATGPEGGIYLAGSGNTFSDIYAEGFSGSRKGIVDNACDLGCRAGGTLDNQFNRFSSRSGGGPLNLSGFSSQSNANLLQTIFGQRENQIAGGDGCTSAYQVACGAGTAPLLTLRDANGNGNKDVSFVDSAGVERWLLQGNGATAQSGLSNAQLFYAGLGNVCTNGELVLSAGWGNTPVGTVTAVTSFGGMQSCKWTITSGGAGQAANPTITDTFTNSFPATVLCRGTLYNPATGALVGVEDTSPLSSSAVFTVYFTPAVSTAYRFERTCGP